jgi:hypothetical protein
MYLDDQAAAELSASPVVDLLNVEPARSDAAKAAAAIRRAIADPSSAGERSVVHLDLARPRRGVWLATWTNLPGLTLDCGRRAYSHALLPKWEYAVAEMRTEMIEDLEHFAATGEQPKAATR